MLIFWKGMEHFWDGSISHRILQLVYRYYIYQAILSNIAYYYINISTTGKYLLLILVLVHWAELHHMIDVVMVTFLYYFTAMYWYLATASCSGVQVKSQPIGYSSKPLKCSLVTALITHDIPLTDYSVTCGVVTLTIPIWMLVV